MKKPPDESTYFKCVKIPTKCIVKHATTKQIIDETVVKANKIVINTLQFIKLYCLNKFHNSEQFPEISEEFINSVMKTVCKTSTKGRETCQRVKTLRNELKEFYAKEFKQLVQNENLDYLHMNTILDYLSVDILTMYENNIKQHYIEYVERFVNVFWEKKFIIGKIRKMNITKKLKDQRIANLCSDLRKIKSDILDVSSDKFKSKSFYHDWIKTIKLKLIPNKTKFEKDNLFYDLQCHPQDYLHQMIYIMNELEQLNISISNVFPLRNDIIPKHIKIDTTSIVHLLMNGEKSLPTDYFLRHGNLKRYEDKIWKFFFRTEQKCFKKKKYTFHHMICTDGVSCSVMLLRNDMIGKRIPKKKISEQEKYIDELEQTEYNKLKTKKIVAYDPNLGDLLYCLDGTDKDRKQFRYTQDQRRNETKQKKYQKIQLDIKNKTKIDNKSIIEMETELADKNRKTLNIEKFKEYVKQKNILNEKLFKFYENELFRKLKFHGYMNRMESERKLIKSFTETFGNPNEVVICAGDYEQKQHMKYKESVKGKDFRNLFRKNGFELYLVNEHRTSCRCFKCEGECEKFRICENPRPWRKNENILRHGLVRCKTCKTLWNRDENSSCNIFKISRLAIAQKDRPKYLCRQKKQLISGASSAVSKGTTLNCAPQNQSLHKVAKPKLCTSLKFR